MNAASPDQVITSYAEAPALTLDAGGETFAYRELGPRGGVPVVFFVHLGATLDNWDPRIVDAVASHRHVITFDQLGVGASSGKVPGTLEEAAEDAYTFITALGLSTIDVVAFSMGGFIAQDLAVRHPGLIRRLVLTGTGPRGGKDIDKVARVTCLDVLRAALVRADPKEFQERTADRDKDITLSAFTTQLKAIKRYGRSAASDLSVITGPTLIANGDHDRMVPTELSHDLHRRIPGSELVIYPNSGHGGIFQHHEEFAPLLADFLADAGESVDG
jgi:pimeloyl-ACP methyl ester carboxylesterase